MESEASEGSLYAPSSDEELESLADCSSAAESSAAESATEDGVEVAKTGASGDECGEGEEGEGAATGSPPPIPDDTFTTVISKGDYDEMRWSSHP